ncbi:MAG: AzlC family ABC transporter permease [Ectothiorhodospiraceae bacterium]|nr:AzlC family ABC transporter permease [Ectothiorhodospiraceae bacterium]
METPGQAVLKGMRDALPVTLTFSFLFVAGGAASQSGGLNLPQGLAMTALVFAAPAQFAAIELMAGQAWLPAMLAIMVINFRFLLMAASITPYLGAPPRRALFPALQMLSASTFATTFPRVRGGELAYPFPFYLGVCLGAFPTALAGTAVGYLVQADNMPWLQDLLITLLPVYFTTFIARAWPNTRFLMAGLLGFFLTPLVSALVPGFGLVITALLVAVFLLVLERRA